MSEWLRRHKRDIKEFIVGEVFIILVSVVFFLILYFFFPYYEFHECFWFFHGGIQR